MHRFQLGILVCLLAGCVSHPTVSSPSQSGPSQSGGRVHSGGRVANGNVDVGCGDTEPLAPAREWRPTSITGSSSLVAPVLRIGLEYLPAEGSLPTGRLPTGSLFQGSAESTTHPRVESTNPTTTRPSPRARAAADENAARTRRYRLDFDAIDDPIAREALHFVNDLVEADERRVRRDVGLPFFGIQAENEARGPLLASEQALEHDREHWLQEHATELLRRPVRDLLRRLPIARAVELEFEDFRSDNVPLSEPYQELHVDRRPLGHLSLRLHADDLADPVEVAWIRSGMRLASSQEYGKAGVTWDLSPAVRLEMRGRTNYYTGQYDWRANLGYRPTTFTSFHVAIGDDMDFLSTSSLYSLFESPMDGAPGIVLYAVHTF